MPPSDRAAMTDAINEAIRDAMTAGAGLVPAPTASRWATMVLALGTLAACATGTAAGTAADDPRWARGTDARQCEPATDGRAALDAEMAALRAAGVTASDPQCGSDGRMRPQMCGAPAGRLWFLRVPPGTPTDALRARGWRPASEWPDAQAAACR